MRPLAMRGEDSGEGTPRGLTQTAAVGGGLASMVNRQSGGFNGITTSYSYNNRLQPWMIQLSASNGNICLVYNYFSTTWTPPSTCPDPSTVPTTGTGNNGSVMGYVDLDSVHSAFGHSAAYIYDSLNRLATATAKSLAGSTLWSYTYSYDRWGNATCSPGGVDCPALTYKSNNSNQLATIGSSSFSYDAAGNMTTDPSNYPVATHYYQWDAEGRVSAVDPGLSPTWSFTYNAVGDRVQWAYGSSGAADQHLFDPAGGWLGIDGQYSLVRRGDGVLVVNTGSETYSHHVNHLGSTTAMTNHGGAAAEDMAFFPWGNVWYSWGSGGYNFAEMPYYDGSTSTSPTMNRFYSMNLGRWLSPDAMAGDITNPQSLNRYAYVLNNPTTLTDPEGLQGCPPGTTQGPGPGQCSGNALAMTQMQMNWGVMFGWDLLQLLTTDTICEGMPCFSRPDLVGMAVALLLATKQVGGGIVATNPSQAGPQQKAIASMLSKLESALACDPECTAFLAQKGLDPVQTLTDIINNDLYGHANISVGGSPYANAAVSGLVAGQAITVNNQGAFFFGSTPGGSTLSVGPNGIPGGTAQAQAFILLHELGHNTGVLRPDAGIPKAGAQNDKDIQAHCQKTINAFK